MYEGTSPCIGGAGSFLSVRNTAARRTHHDFSRVTLDHDGLDVRALAELAGADGYGVHQLLWRLFPNAPDADRDFLYRQEIAREQLREAGSARGTPIFYMVSAREPGALPGLLAVESKTYTPKLKAGQRLAFELRANPTVTRNGARHDVLMDAKRQAQEQQLPQAEWAELMNAAAIDWLQGRAQDRGFALLRTPQVDGYRQHRLRPQRKQKPIRFSSVDYQGILEVQDPDLLCETLYHGIGRARSFGCGLLLVRRV